MHRDKDMSSFQTELHDEGADEEDIEYLDEDELEDVDDSDAYEVYDPEEER